MTSDTHPVSSAFDNLESMRVRHHALLEADATPGSQEIQDFLRAGRELGTKLLSSRDRNEAQGMLSFWAATLASSHTPEHRGPAQAAKMESSAPEEVSGFVALDSFDQSAADERAVRAKEALKKLSPPERAQMRADMRRLLPYLLRLEGASGQMALVRLPSDATELKMNGADSPGFRFLKDVELLVQRTNADGTSDYSLANESLLQMVDELRDYRNERVAFRELARGWARAGRPDAALLNDGPQLQRAKAYRDKNDVEDEFVQQSTKFAVRRRRRWYAALIVPVALIVLAIFAGIVSKRNADRRERALKEKAEHDLRALELQDQKNRQRAAEEALEAARRNEKLLQEEREELAKRVSELTDQLAELSKAPGLTPELKEKFVYAEDAFLRAAQRPIERQAVPENLLVPGAGVKVKAGDRTWTGTAGIFLKKPGDDRAYLAGPRGLIPDGPVEVYRVGSLGESLRPENLVASVGALAASGDLWGLVAVPLRDRVKISNTIPSLGAITGYLTPAQLEEIKPARPQLAMRGFVSGVRTGRLLDYDREKDLVYTDPMSSPGDAGAVMVTQDGRVVGVVMGSDIKDSKRTLVKPIGGLLASGGYRLALPENRKSQLFEGAQLELFISEEEEADVAAKAQRQVDSLIGAGLKFPVSLPQPKKRVASVTEVRHFFAEDRPLAEKVVELMRTAGFNAPIRISFVDDKSAPRKFIQISVAKGALK